MNFEIIEKEVKQSKPDIKCNRCDLTNTGEYTYFMMKDCFYCDKCYSDVPFMKSAIDKRFEELEKKSIEHSNSLVVKNDRIRVMEGQIEKLEEILNNIFATLNEAAKNDVENIKNQE